MNAFIDKFVNNKNTLSQFVLHFDRAIKKQRHNLLAGEHENFYTKPQLMVGCEMEVQMSKIYTRAKFNIFQEELVQSMNYATNMLLLDSYRTYMVRRFVRNDKAQPKEVIYRGHNEVALCSCKKLQSEGIPCRHILVVLRNKFLTNLPAQYILQRWTISAISEVVVDENGVELGGKYGKEKKIEGFISKQ